MKEGSQIHIVSLGSSFAAGPGIPPSVGPRAAFRSGRNYAHILAELLDAKLTDLTVSGSTLLNITTEPQAARFSKHVFPPQVFEIPEDADIITVTAGGNDIQYIGGMMFDAWAATIPGKVVNFIVRVVTTFSSVITRKKNPQPVTTMTTETLAERLGDVLDDIHRRVPKAQIFLVEYLAVLGPCTQPAHDIQFGQDKISHHCEVASRLQKAYAMAAESRTGWCERVPVHRLSLEHALGSRDPWVGGFGLRMLMRRGPVLHPNSTGMNAVANILFSRIKHLQSIE